MLYTSALCLQLMYISVLIIITISFTFIANKPEKHILLRLLYPVKANCHEIGYLLGVDSNTIDMLYTSNYSDQMKMSKMLQSWLDNEPTPVTWDNIIDVIEGPLQKKSLAMEIRKFLMDRFRYTYIYNIYICR